MKIFGFTISLSKKNKATTTATVTNSKKRATKAIRKQIKREVSWQINDIKTALDFAKNFDNPDRSKLFKIYDYIRKDAHLQSQIKTAFFKVESEPWLLYKDGKPDEAASKLYRRLWFNKLIHFALEKEFYSFTLVEADGIDPANYTIKKLVSIDREYVCIEKQLILLEGTINGDNLPYGDIISDIDLIQFGDGEGFGCLLECSYNVIWKYYARNDWSRANEKVGTPILSIVADTNNDDELDAIENKAANFGTDGYIIGQKGDVHEFLERKSDNFYTTFKDMILLCNDEISKAINGQTGTTEAVPFVGSGEVMERTMDDFTIARLQNIVDEMKENVFPFLIKKGFNLEGYEFDYPRLVKERERKTKGISTPTNVKEKEPEPTK